MAKKVLKNKVHNSSPVSRAVVVAKPSRETARIAQSIREGMQDMVEGKVHPISELWDGIDE